MFFSKLNLLGSKVENEVVGLFLFSVALFFLDPNSLDFFEGLNKNSLGYPFHWNHKNNFLTSEITIFGGGANIGIAFLYIKVIFQDFV